MPKRLHNWTYGDVVQFLKEHHFQLNHSRGSHHYFFGFVGEKQRNVCVPYHGSTAIKPRTMKGIILQSGIAKEDWFSSMS